MKILLLISLLTLTGCSMGRVNGILEAVENNGCKYSFVDYDAKKSRIKLKCLHEEELK